jgi:tRNA modification GTPase
VVIDGSQPLTSEDREALAETSKRRRLVALNKSDLSTFAEARLCEYFPARAETLNSVSVSAKTGSGIGKLRDALAQPFVNGNLSSEGLLITNARHHDLLVRATEAIRASENLLMVHASEELILVGLHNALRYLGELTGETTSDEILGEIFSTFCIGK